MARKGGKMLTWALLSAWTGFTFVGYFTPIQELWDTLWRFQLGPWEAFWLLFYSGFTYMNAGHMREQVCKYMCPYARFQGVMFDPDTLTITYDEARGEARGARKKGVDPKSIGKGDCVDCHICVQVCPTGIDIRDGLQYECIGCAACIDACDQVMDKMGYPRGLIRYSTENALSQRWGWQEILRHVVRPRVLVYSAILAVVTGRLPVRPADEVGPQGQRHPRSRRRRPRSGRRPGRERLSPASHERRRALPVLFGQGKRSAGHRAWPATM